jgi:hypothetical protein
MLDSGHAAIIFAALSTLCNLVLILDWALRKIFQSRHEARLDALPAWVFIVIPTLSFFVSLPLSQFLFAE